MFLFLVYPCHFSLLFNYAKLSGGEKVLQVYCGKLLLQRSMLIAALKTYIMFIQAGLRFNVLTFAHQPAHLMFKRYGRSCVYLTASISQSRKSTSSQGGSSQSITEDKQSCVWLVFGPKTVWDKTWLFWGSLSLGSREESVEIRNPYEKAKHKY